MPKFCHNGHQIEESWDSCPYCAKTGYRCNSGVLGMTRLEAEPGNASLGSARKTVLIGEERQPALVGWLVVMDGEDRGKDYRLREGQNILGSGGSVDVVIADKTISTKHASVRYRDRKFLLTDLDSTNGTYLNDNAEAISREELRDNDLLRLGGVCLRFKRL